jgi:hypothetical protein
MPAFIRDEAFSDSHFHAHCIRHLHGAPVGPMMTLRYPRSV